MFEYEVRQSVTSVKAVYAVSPGGMRSCTGFSAPIETTVMFRKVIGSFLPRAGEVIARLGTVEYIEHDIFSKVAIVFLESIEKNHGEGAELAIRHITDCGFLILEVIGREADQ